MNTKHWHRLRQGLVPAVLGALLAAGAIAVVLVLLPSSSSTTGDPDIAGQPVSAALPADQPTRGGSPTACVVAQIVDPGEYESVERTGSAAATWIIIPESYEQIAPAPLFVLSVAGFTGATEHLDLLRPAFESLDGVVLVTGVEANGDELSALIAEVTSDFCVDEQRIITSQLPSLGSPRSPEPEPETPRSTALAT